MLFRCAFAPDTLCLSVAPAVLLHLVCFHGGKTGRAVCYNDAFLAAFRMIAALRFKAAKASLFLRQLVVVLLCTVSPM